VGAWIFQRCDSGRRDYRSRFGGRRSQPERAFVPRHRRAGDYRLGLVHLSRAGPAAADRQPSTAGAPFCIIPDGTFTTTATNNIALASTAVVNKLLCYTFDSTNKKYVPSY
jgi:hypothetical protein